MIEVFITGLLVIIVVSHLFKDGTKRTDVAIIYQAKDEEDAKQYASKY